MKRLFAFSDTVLRFRKNFLQDRGLNDSDHDGRKKIATSIKKLSDYFIEQPEGATPWNESWAQEAYLSYYLPLNEIRNRAVIKEGLASGFFHELTDVIDFGSGPGTADFALESLVPELSSYTLIERSEVPERLLRHPSWKFTTVLRDKDFKNPQKTLFVASYSLTEAKLPPEALQSEALMILEPSTRQDGRALLQLRDDLIKKGFFIWAPCTHQMDCPLLSQSPRDWCHDRVHVDRSPEWIALEELLPFRNQTITFSYLLARRSPPPIVPSNLVRLVGDSLPEKGKTRQMICRGPEREFIAWLHRQGAPPDWPRGALMEIPADALRAGQELRLTPPRK